MIFADDVRAVGRADFSRIAAIERPVVLGIPVQVDSLAQIDQRVARQLDLAGADEPVGFGIDPTGILYRALAMMSLSWKGMARIART